MVHPFGIAVTNIIWYWCSSQPKIDVPPHKCNANNQSSKFFLSVLCFLYVNITSYFPMLTDIWVNPCQIDQLSGNFKSWCLRICLNFNRWLVAMFEHFSKRNKHLHANYICNVKVSKNAPTNGQWPELATSTQFCWPEKRWALLYGFWSIQFEET